MTRISAATLLVVALAAIAQPGCGGPTYVVEQYAGPRRDSATIATLRFRGNDAARLVMVDGERADVTIDEDARLHVEVLPGEHSVAVVNANDLQGPLHRVSFRAEAGKLYRVVLVEKGGSNPARVYEVGSDDALLRDVTLPARDDRDDPRPFTPIEQPEPEPEPEPEPASQPEAADAGAAPADGGG